MTVVDSVEAGSGPVVVLVHSSAAGAHQWRRLMGELEDRYRVIAPNLFGYGATRAWTAEASQTLDDQAGLVASALPDSGARISIVGHSFGGSVAMKVAARLGPSVEKLVLIEPNPFSVLDQNGRAGAYAEIMDIRNLVVGCGETGEWAVAAEGFADYWNGAGSWAAMPDDRKTAFAEALRQNYHEWDAVLDERTTLQEWASALPAMTLVVSAQQTARPIREIVELMRDVCRTWRFEKVADGGHMAPLTRPDLVNPIVAGFLDGA